ncbi:MAG: hypothetical protein AABX70_02995 [Nanoarchaeota archaeon]
MIERGGVKSISILTATRDRPIGLKSTLSALVSDIDQASPFPIRSIVIDDSNTEEARNLNRELAAKFDAAFPRGCLYFGRPQYALFVRDLPEEVKQTFTSTTKPLGANFYDSVGPRNIALLLSYSDDFVFIIDDDVIIQDPNLGNQGSSIEKMIKQLVIGEADIIGANWVGIPDQSTMEHLDDQVYAQLHPEIGLPPSFDEPFRLNIEPRLIGWRRHYPSYTTSGGGMGFSSDLSETHFPKIFNDDWHWVSYNHHIKKKKVRVDDTVTFLNKPPGWRFPSKDTLIRELMGDIIFEAIHQYSEQTGNTGWRHLDQVDWGGVARQYHAFLGYVKRDVEVLTDVKPLSQGPFDDYKILLPHLRETMSHLEGLNPNVFHDLIDSYVQEIRSWSQMIRFMRDREPSWSIAK